MGNETSSRQCVRDLKAGSAVDERYVLAERTVSSKRDGAPFLSLALSDRTGRIKGVVWEQVDLALASTAVGQVVHVRGTVTEYRGEIQLVVKQMTAVSGEAVQPSDFLPTTERDIEAMFEALVHMTDSMQSEDLRRLFQAFWADASLVARFKQAPAAKLMHHAYIGGLLEHCLSMATLADKIAHHYAGVDRDLLLAGAVLHDIGKVREFAYTASIDYSDEGRLVSHIVIGVEMLDEKLSQLTDFSPERARLLKHLIVSHHGSREFGSPEPPKTIEAVLLNHIDEIDSKVNGIRSFMADEDPQGAWTGYHRLLGRHFYTGRPQSTEG